MDLLDIIRALPQQIREGVHLGKDVKLTGAFSNIVVTGMGGSGIPGDILKCLLRDCKIPIVVNKDYTLPGFVNRNTIVFAISYSGNTEETVSAYKEAKRKMATTVVITSGGKLRDLARNDNAPTIIVPAGQPPRSAVAYFVFSMLMVLHNAGVRPVDIDEIKATMEAVKNPAFEKKAKQIAEEIKGKIPIIYAAAPLESVALRWKQEFNENAKIHAFYNAFSEMDHNELMAYKNAKDTFQIIILKDERDNPQNKKRMDHLKKILKQKRIPVTELLLKGNNHMVKVFTALYTGSLLTYFLAKELGEDPVETSLIEDLKKQL